ncbi:MAG TPA: nucleoside deaminase [Tenuifilaceae bacterium]|nr:nucleoside deaminase [Tenuifilaceae bacterium]HPQ34352.1 nucleoside deaminase [Tenuifilaceae bacterium]
MLPIAGIFFVLTKIDHNKNKVTGKVDHSKFMREALKEAEFALNKGEVPVGAVVVCNNTVVARAHNLTETLNDPTAHAEMQAITSAFSYLGGKYLNECTLYVTLEPCVMCAGALFWSQLGTLVYGADDPKRGFTLVKQNLLHPKTKLVEGIMDEEASILMKTFFRTKR